MYGVVYIVMYINVQFKGVLACCLMTKQGNPMTGSAMFDDIKLWGVESVR